MCSVSRLSLCVLMFAPLSFGDRIVSGWIRWMGEGAPGAYYEIRGRDFDFPGFIYSGWPGDGEIVSPGDSVGTNAFAGDFGVSSGTYKGKYYPRLMFTSLFSAGYSWLEISGPTVVVDGPGVYHAPFEAVGWVCGIIEITSWHTPCDVFVELQGSGTTTLFVADIGDEQLRVTGVRYDFTVPEPGTFVLLVTGLAVVAGATWRRRVRRS